MNIIDKIAIDLKLDNIYISRIASRSAYYYRDFIIPKKNGDKRYVSQPSPELKTLQYWIIDNVLSKLPHSSSAYAYKKGDSIKKHALLHCRSRFIFHTDIQRFFPSIHPSHLESILRENHHIFDELKLDLDESIKNIYDICFRDESVCIGAVSSPTISNVIMYSFDETISAHCQKHNYIYSRYADDIYISSNHFIEKEIISVIESELSKISFKVNYNKTQFYSSKYRRKVTGLILTNESKVSIGTELRNKINKMIYNKLIHGIGNSNQILGYGELVNIANNAIWQYRDLYLRPNFYAENEARVRTIIADVITQYQNGEMDYNKACFEACVKIYQSVNPSFNPDIEFAKDTCYRDIPSVDNSLFAIARKLISKSK